MEWIDFKDRLPETDGQRVRVRITHVTDMYYVPSCKQAEWLMVEDKFPESSKEEWQPIGEAVNYFDKKDD